MAHGRATGRDDRRWNGVATSARLRGRHDDEDDAMPQRVVEEMLPGDVVAARDRCPYALVPVSPMVEWHSWHLPLSTDGIIAETLCALAAERLGCISFRTLPLGLDAWRTPGELEAWGFAPQDRVFGMCFPEVPVSSEYCEPEHLRAVVGNRLAQLRASGFSGACLYNQHGGKGQGPMLDAIAAEWSAPGFRVAAISSWQIEHGFRHDTLRVGGHAGLSETHWVLAFRPDLVDLTRLPDGELSVRATGILHSQPLIEPQYNPRQAVMAVAHELRDALVDALVARMRTSLIAPATAGGSHVG
jgi:creatinine amidohydrolase/Fe(II)-dependent formamide hydrolase-like protein